ncbi:hypothetical protein SUGI_0464910 [Cryptomeria japonica]|uniref:wall-associated receptor kinase 2 n=1 Tax=Cryptomeria japonica TaxID=3369 RepID=UPI002408B76E|nr:wall-associated receptor kinase 2 [Cryptomeria japonica]GLJ24354.1 hypothetical protein SUGI_0464910 [Cryptomeria japonica]
MDCRGVVRFLICVCMVGFTGAKCVPEKCGSMNVSYPFWIKNSHCGYPGFQVTCRKDPYSGILAPFFTAYSGNYTDEYLQGFYYRIIEIDYTGSLIINSSSIWAQSCISNSTASAYFQPPLGGPFTISMSNKFIVIGCNAVGSYTYGDWGEARCVSTCDSQTDPPYCRYGCCEITLPDNWAWLNFTGGSLFSLLNTTTCGLSTILEPSTFTIVDNNTNLFWGDGLKAYHGLRLNWGISLQNCSMAKATANYSCASSNAECIDSPSGQGHVCRCLPGYEGNGYSNGTDCTDTDECKGSNMCVGAEEGGICHNFAGTYNCSCAEGYKGDGFHNGTRCISRSSNYLKLAIIGAVSSFVGVSMVACGLFWCLSMRRSKHAREKNFRQNGGIQLQERIASMGGKESLKIFSERELEMASNKFSTELGKGGFATVYKGVLVNVFDHLHSRENHLTWKTRRQIAIETAEAIAYVHLQAAQPIFHRDIKSSNILLDNTFTPKVADFGLSRLRPSDDRHLSIMFASGTPGYVDPEFVRSNQFTDKSDVFSFGVVLVELLTGLKPLLSIGESTCALYDHFLSAINDNHLIEIFDPKVVKEEIQGQMENMARLAKACL